MMQPKLFSLIEDLPSSNYHGMEGSYSSSQLKTMLEDPIKFYKKYISKEIPRESLPAFDIGTYFHTALLEPHKLNEECAVYSEGVRFGKKWDEFKAANPNKAIITGNEKETAEKIIAAVKNSPLSMDYLKNSKSEISCFIEVTVFDGEIFCLKEDGCYMLVDTGWAKTSMGIDVEGIAEFGTKLILKTRADALDVSRGIISDLKSTRGNCLSGDEMSEKVSSFKYQLSAAFYLDVFTVGSGVDFHSFIWLFASKDMGNARPYKASDKSIMYGREMWKKAILGIAKYSSRNWVFGEELGEI